MTEIVTEMIAIRRAALSRIDMEVYSKLMRGMILREDMEDHRADLADFTATVMWAAQVSDTNREQKI